jgi:hypothetical protein
MMTRYMGCLEARERLEDFVDGELPMTEQVVLESHLRWCTTCVARVEDMRLIGSHIRTRSPLHGASGSDTPALAEMQAAVLARIGTERAESLQSWIRDTFEDMRLLWPALGATVAVAVCVAVAFGVLRLASEERPESLAAMLDALSQPGTERNPLIPAKAPSFERPVQLGKAFENRSSGGISIPRVLDDGAVFGAVPDEGSTAFTVAAVVSRQGRVATYEVLPSRPVYGALRYADQVGAVQDAVRLSRFEPAQTPTGEVVAVNVIWVIIHQTVKGSLDLVAHEMLPKPAIAPAVSPAVQPALPVEPRNRRSSIGLGSPTA